MKILIIVLFISSITFAQDFQVKKVTGKVLVQHGIENSFSPVKIGDKLSGDDLVITEKNSFIQLTKGGEVFLLKSNSALGLNYIREISLNDLLLALAMEEIRNVPPNKNKAVSKNTAVYGENISLNSSGDISQNKLGEMKINGAKQLATNGFTESAIIVSKDTFRKYPSTKSNFENRIYFANLLNNLELYNEALDEYKSIKKESISIDQKESLNRKIELISQKISSN